MTAPPLSADDLAQLQRAIAADMEDADPDLGGPDLGRFVTACPWTHVLELVANLLAVKAVETAEGFTSAAVNRMTELVRQYGADLSAKGPS